MPAPLTGFEVDGTWTTLERESAFLAQIDAVTAAAVTQAGTSGQGRPIWRTSLGTGTARTMLIVTLQHGNEQASREAALSQIRDLAYSTDPAVRAYLAEHRIVWMTNANPDGFVAGVRGVSPAWADPNRDHLRLTFAETRTIAAVIRDTRPHMIIDAHEYFAQGQDWWSFPGGLPHAHPALAALEADCNAKSTAVIRSHGYTAAQYPIGGIPRAGLANVAGHSSHAVTMLSETNALHGNPDVRVDVQRIILDMFRDWHEDNAAACTAAQTASRLHALRTREPYQLYTTVYVGDPPTPINVAGYQLAPGASLPQRHIDAFGIVVDPGGFVSMSQEARLIIPQLLDPASMDVQAEATRVPWPEREPLPGKRLVGMRVQVDGQSMPVVAMRHRSGGVTREVRFT